MSRSKESRQCSGSDREQARRALTRGKRAEAGVEAKLRKWGQCDGQVELWSRQDLRTDRQVKR